MWQILLNGQLFTAPHPKVTSLLDLGCGSGVWTAAVAKHLPAANVAGVDITPPANDFGLKNLSIIKANIEEPWGIPILHRRPFDIITLRVLVSAIGHWPNLIEKCYESLKPGGWIELHDITIGTFSDAQDWRDESSPLMRWFQHYRKGASRNGINGFASYKRRECLTRAHFTNVSEKWFRCYLYEDDLAPESNRKVAGLARQNMFGLLKAVTKALVDSAQANDLGMDDVELRQLEEEAKKDVIENCRAKQYYWVL